MKSLFKLALFFGLTVSVTSCSDTKSPNYQFFPNMYESVGYETYAESEAFNGKNQLKGGGTALTLNFGDAQICR